MPSDIPNIMHLCPRNLDMKKTLIAAIALATLFTGVSFAADTAAPAAAPAAAADTAAPATTTAEEKKAATTKKVEKKKKMMKKGEHKEGEVK